MIFSQPRLQKHFSNLIKYNCDTFTYKIIFKERLKTVNNVAA